MQMKYAIFLALLFLNLLGNVKGENRFNTKIELPASIKLDKIGIQYYNGIQTIPFKIGTQSHTIEISDIYYSKYVVLIIRYNIHGYNEYSKKYFLEKRSELDYRNNLEENLESVKLIGAYDLKEMGEGKLDIFAKEESINLESFLEANGKYLSDNSSIMQKYVALDSALRQKKLEFIQANTNLFYSLWLFREEFVSNYDFDVDSLYKIYQKFPPAEFSNTFETKQIETVFNGRRSTSEGKIAPLFSSLDIKGDKIDLSNFRNKKYIILNFWASWCGPCMAETPTLDSINKFISSKDVAIISVSVDNNKEKCLKAIEKFQMNWINILNDPFVCSAYGNKRELPQVYLIDKKGKIIYSRSEENDVDLRKLFDIVKKL